MLGRWESSKSGPKGHVMNLDFSPVQCCSRVLSGEVR